MCGVFSVLACSVDARTLSLASTNDSAGASGGALGSDGSNGPSEFGASGDQGNAPDTGEAPGNQGACGDGWVDASEECDDGDRANLDGCDSACKRELGYQCSGEPSACRSCVGMSPARRCAIQGGPFQLDPAQSAVPSDISSFQLDELEVTVARFREYVTSFVGAPKAGTAAHPEIEHSGWQSEWAAVFPANQERLIASLHCNADWETWTDQPSDREDYPLTCASYYVAFAFCAWSGGRLPSEVEWEYAASGGAQERVYPWGNEQPSLERALFGASSLAPAGAHRSGMARFGQLDLAGSAWEWTLDLYRPYPATCDHCAEVEKGSDRVLRGGAFLYDAEFLRASYRFHTDPQLALGDVGFRCAYAADAPQ